MAIVSTEKNLDIYSIGNALESLGWKSVCTPVYPCLHFTLHQANKSNLSLLIELIQKAVEMVRSDPKKYKEGPQKLIKEVQALPTSVSVKAMQECYHELYKIDNLTTSTQPVK